ncbi:MAG: hypothetical protein PUF72_11130 [Clostridiales bacterium]|nr:hypothetical protein [Clostridiales bacterium]
MRTIKASWAILPVICMMAQLFTAMPAVTAAADVDIIAVEKLQVEYQTNPIGMDNTAPRFSWTLQCVCWSGKNIHLGFTALTGALPEDCGRIQRYA